MNEIEVLVGHYLPEWNTPGWAHAFHGLIELGPVALPFLEQTFTATTDSRLRAEIVVIASQYRSDLSLPLLGLALSDRDADVWKAALDGLVGLASAASVAALEQSIGRTPAGTDPSEWRTWIAEAVAQARTALQDSIRDAG